MYTLRVFDVRFALDRPSKAHDVLAKANVAEKKCCFNGFENTLQIITVAYFFGLISFCMATTDSPQ